MARIGIDSSHLDDHGIGLENIDLDAAWPLGLTTNHLQDNNTDYSQNWSDTVPPLIFPLNSTSKPMALWRGKRDESRFHLKRQSGWAARPNLDDASSNPSRALPSYHHHLRLRISLSAHTQLIHIFICQPSNTIASSISDRDRDMQCRPTWRQDSVNGVWY